MNIDIDDDALDGLTIENLYNTYETVYWTLIDTQRRYEKDKRVESEKEFYKEDIREDMKILNALENILNYFSYPSFVEKRLLDIRNEVINGFEGEEYKEMIAERMNDSK